LAGVSALFIGLIIPGSMALASAQARTPMAPTLVPPAVPSNLQVPPGNVAYLKYHAVGTQNYICLPESPDNPFAYRWSFQGPQATLFNPVFGFQTGTHYLSAITPPDSGGLPTWQNNTGATVRATKVAASTDPAFVDPSAIPWFLLKTVFSKGSGGVAGASYIQRVNTQGGLGPGQLTNTQPPPETTSCATGADVGKLSFEPYQADYVFYRSVS
jgi:hypothetical protein